MKGVKLQLFGLGLLILALIRWETISTLQLWLCLFGLVLLLVGLMLKDV